MKATLRKVRKYDEKAHKSAFPCINERLGGEPLPHECARRAIVHRFNETLDVVVHCVIDGCLERLFF